MKSVSKAGYVLLQWVLAMVKYYEGNCGAALHVRQVSTRTGALVDQITSHYSDDTIDQLGGDGGSEENPFVLNDGEYIVAIHGNQDDNLSAIQFETSHARKSP